MLGACMISEEGNRKTVVLVTKKYINIYKNTFLF